jgi:hypothetical protein
MVFAFLVNTNYKKVSTDRAKGRLLSKCLHIQLIYKYVYVEREVLLSMRKQNVTVVKSWLIQALRHPKIDSSDKENNLARAHQLAVDRKLSVFIVSVLHLLVSHELESAM